MKVQNRSSYPTSFWHATIICVVFSLKAGADVNIAGDIKLLKGPILYNALPMLLVVK